MAVLVCFLLLASTLSFLRLPPSVYAPQSTSFTFAAAGDLDANANTNASLVRLGSSGSSFFLAIGDLSYNTITPELAWCNYVKSYLGSSYPFQLLSGNHEDGNEEQNGLIDNFVQCLPNQVGGINGTYGKEYYFDYPSSSPLARFIMISPGLNFTYGGFWSYAAGTSHYNWLASAIDSARAAGIRWIIVGMHEVCISAGQHPCEVGADVMNLLINRKVDLVLQGHDHTYQRSKQLSCAQAELYISSCVVNDGSSGVYTEGAGTVFVIAGTFGAGETPIVTSDSDLGYFAKTMGNTTVGASHGFVKYTVSSASISVQTAFAGSFADSFSIQSGSTLPVTITPPSTSPQVGQIATFTGTVTSGGTPPYTLHWDFGDGGTASGSSPSHMFLQTGYYTIKLNVTDATSKIGSTQTTVAVGSWNPAVTLCAPFQTTLEALLGNVPISRGGGQGADYSGGAFQLEGKLPYGSTPLSKNWPYTKRWLPSSLPCSVRVNGTLTAAFVEIDNVQIRGISIEDCTTINKMQYCDTTFNVCDPTGAKAGGGDTQCGSTYPDTMFKFHTEIDQMWKYNNGQQSIAPPDPGPNGSIGCANYNTTQVCYVDIQGWVYWDDMHVSESWHSFSGWEIHPLAAWKLHNPIPTASFTAGPSSPSPGQTVTFTATASGGSSPYSFTWDFGDGSTGTGSTVTHSYSTGSYGVRVGAKDSKGSVGTASRQLVVQDKPPVVRIVLSRNTAFVGQTVTISITSSDPDGTISQTVVDWGDDTIDTFTSAVTSDGHSYSDVGNYIVKATVTDNGGVTAFDADPEHIVDFTVTGNPTSLIIPPGSSGSSTLQVGSVNNFTGTVSLSSTVSPSGPSVSLGLNSLRLAAGSTNSTSLTVSVPNGTPANLYNVNVTLTSGPRVQFVLVSVTVPSAPDFTISTTPSDVTINAGVTGTSNITVSHVNGFTATVTLSAATNSTNLVCSLSSTTITGGSGSSSLSCHGSPAGNYLATVTGTSSGLPNHSAGVTYNIEDFSTAANPSSVSSSVNIAGNSTISIIPINGFGGTVTLAVSTSSNDLTCTLSSTSITGGSGASTLSCVGTKANTFTATVTATSATLSHAVTVTYTISARLTLTSNPTSVSVLVRATGTSTITVSIPTDGTTNLTVSTNSTSLGCSLTPTSVTGTSGTSTLSCTGSSIGNYFATVTGTNGPNSATTNVTFHIQDFTITANPPTVNANIGVAGTSTITVAPVNGFTGPVNLGFVTNSTNLVCTLSSSSITGGSGTSTLSCTGSVVGNYLVTVSGSNDGLSHSIGLIYHVVPQPSSFTIMASPVSVSVSAGSSSSSTITVSPVDGFAGTVTLTVTSSSTNLSCSLSSTSITGGSGNSTLSCTGTVAANYNATVTGTNDGISHSASVTYHVQDFTVTASPASVTTLAGTSATSTLMITPINGFSGTVTLPSSVNAGQLTCTLNPVGIVLGPQGTSNLSCSGPAGNYTVRVAGSSGGLSHAVTVSVIVQDFTTTATSPTGVNVSLSASSTITVTGVNHFSGTVTLSDTVPSGLTCGAIAPSSVAGSGTSSVSCTASTAGNYTLTITGTSTTLSHSATVIFRFKDFTISASPTSLSVNAGVTGTSTVTIAPLNGFTGTVSLSFTVSPAGLNCLLGPTTIILGGSQSSTLSCTGTTGGYTVTIAGTSGSLSHTVTIGVIVQPVPADLTKTVSSESDIAPESQQHTFRDPRGLQGYYVFYRQTVSGNDRCYYAYSADGLSWTVNQTISDIASYSGMNSCSVAYREDPANSRLVVYIVFTKPDTITGTTHSIRFAVGFIPDNTIAISWLSSGLVRAASSTEQMAYAIIARAGDGYLHVAAAYVVDNAGSNSDRQTVIVCSSNTPDPFANPAWTCSDPNSSFPFAGTTIANVTRPTYMPQVISGLSGHDVLIIAGPCKGNEYLTCSAIDSAEQSRILDWDGIAQTWGSLASFTPSPGSPADRRSATINPVTGRVHYAYQDSTASYLSRYLDSPYSSWSATSTITSITGNSPAGLHLSLVTGSSSQTLIAFYVLPISGGIYSKNSTDSQLWGAQQTELTNSTYKFKVVSSQSLVDGTRANTIPYVWIVSAKVTELWFKTHTISSSSGLLLSVTPISNSTSPGGVIATVILFVAASTTIISAVTGRRLDFSHRRRSKNVSRTAAHRPFSRFHEQTTFSPREMNPPFICGRQIIGR